MLDSKKLEEKLAGYEAAQKKAIANAQQLEGAIQATRQMLGEALREEDEAAKAGVAEG